MSMKNYNEMNFLYKWRKVAQSSTFKYPSYFSAFIKKTLQAFYYMLLISCILIYYYYSFVYFSIVLCLDLAVFTVQHIKICIIYLFISLFQVCFSPDSIIQKISKPVYNMDLHLIIVCPINTWFVHE